jgi:hypothetical protein
MAVGVEPLKTVRVITNANSRLFRTVNIVTTKANDPANQFPTWLQAAGAVPSNTYETVQASGAKDTIVKGLKTVFISGYNAPS